MVTQFCKILIVKLICTCQLMYMDQEGFLIFLLYIEILSMKCSWLYNLFRSKLERELKNTLRSKICENVHATTTEWNTAIASYPCKEIYQLDYHMYIPMHHLGKVCYIICLYVCSLCYTCDNFMCVHV